MNKYGAKRTLVDGIWFDSGGEGDRYLELKLLERANEIRDLELQVPYPMFCGSEPILTAKGRQRVYKADFRYYDRKRQQWVIEDFKGFETKEFKLKRDILRAMGITIEIVKKQRR